MSFLEEFQSNLESLPNTLQRKYALLRDLDKSLLENQRQNEQRCEQEIEDFKNQVKAGNITHGSSLIRFSDEALEEQKHAIRIADEKVTLAVQAYDLVDAHIQQLDQYLKKFDEELRRERENAAATGLSGPNVDGNVKPGRGGESGRGGRKNSLSCLSILLYRSYRPKYNAEVCPIHSYRNLSIHMRTAIRVRLFQIGTRLGAGAAAAATSTANPTTMDLDIPVDPNEPTYCFCNQVSYGEMVACDNPDCKIEWFHFGCVGLKDQPKGKWYCSECVGKKNRRKGK